MAASPKKSEITTLHVAASDFESEERAAGVDTFLTLKGDQNYSERLSAISHFSMEIAHHVNNCLTPIICYAQMLSQSTCTPQQRNKLEKIQEAAAQAKDVIDSLMSFSQGHPTQIAPVDINRVVRESVPVASDLLWLDRDHMVVETPVTPVVILGDFHQLSQALLHILKNSLEATSADNRRVILRSYTNENGEAVLEVTDNGRGIPHKALAKVLLPFFTTAKGERAGLGLAIVSGIAEGHGAEIEIETEEGSGTTVRIVFPALPTSRA